MALKLGTTALNKLYLGGTEIKKAYLGTGVVSAIPTIASAVYWGDFSDTSKVSLSSGKITGLANRLGGALSFSQDTGSLQPTYQLASAGNGINGLNTCRFTERTQKLQLDTAVLTDATIIIVIRNTSNQSEGGVIQSITDNFAGLFRPNTSSNANQPAGISDNFVDGVDIPNTRGATRAALTTSPVLWMVRNLDLTDWGQSSSGITAIMLGSFHISSIYSFVNGDMGEIVIMNAPSVAEQNALGVYLSEKWGTATWTDVS